MHRSKMAGAIPKRGGVQRMMDCPVCLSGYNTRDRVPKALGCHHSLCKLCVENMIKEGTVSCPKCRKETSANDVGTNYTLTDILDALCEECLTQDREENCSHCHLNLCSSCTEQHSRLTHEELKDELDKLSQELSEAMDRSKESSQIKKIRSMTDDVLGQIRTTFSAHRANINSYEKELIDRAMQLRDENIKSHVTWRELLDCQIAKTKTFMDHTFGKISEEYSQNISTEEMIKVHTECASHLSGLSDSMNNKVFLAEFSFVGKKDAVYKIHHELGKITGQDQENNGMGKSGQINAAELKCQQGGAGGVQFNPVASIPLVPTKSLQSAKDLKVINYKSAKIVDSIGQLGFGCGQFNQPWGIAFSHDRQHIIVVDQQGHRIQVLDKNLKFLRMFGNKGSGTNQFNEPLGVAVNYRDEIFVADRENHRIQVCSLSGQFLRRFGTPGVRKGQFYHPAGIDHYNGQLFVCDHFNFRIQVITTAGKFVRTFGPINRKVFHKKPFCIKVSSNEKVLVGGISENRQGVHVFSLTGDFLGLLPADNSPIVKPVYTSGITEDAEGNILVTDQDTIKVYTKEGGFVCEIRSKNDRLDYPHGITTDDEGNLFICDTENHRIVKFGVYNVYP